MYMVENTQELKAVVSNSIKNATSTSKNGTDGRWIFFRLFVKFALEHDTKLLLRLYGCPLFVP